MKPHLAPLAIMLSLSLLLTSCSTSPRPQTGGQRGDVNLAHLNFLVEDVKIAGQPMAIIHIYSEAPKYEWVDASGEGIACVDDAARAAVVYLEDYELTRDKQSLDKAYRLLNFTLYMQAEDGEFYNFIYDREGTINKNGITSYKTSGWWAVRAGWALAAGIRVLKDEDETYTARLEESFLRLSEVWSADVAAMYGKFSQVNGVNVPAWLITDGADVTSVALLALLEYDRATGGSHAPTRDLIAKLAEGLSLFQYGDHRNYPFGLHPGSVAAPFAWHAWGSTQTFVLAQAGAQLGKQEWISSARREADAYFSRLTAGQMVNEWGVLPLPYSQIAYGINSIAQGYLALARATQDDTYGKLAGLTVGWLYGNNAAGFAMYDPATGRGYDGLQGSSTFRINLNSGAESTIEALMALQAVQKDPIALQYLHHKPAEEGSLSWQVLEAELADQVAGDKVQSYKTATGTGAGFWSNRHYVTVGPEDSFVQDFSIPATGKYFLYSAFLKQGALKDAMRIEAIKAPTPPVIDGELSEWTVAQPLPANAISNILRGAASWGSAESDAFTAFVMWDQDNFYISAQVLDPGHSQTETGSSVWKGDVLWVYLSTRKENSSVEHKLTFAQTPDGSQVWSWKANSFLPGAQLAWKATETGYTYEAALPWKSLNVTTPDLDREMGLELGRGCCITGFMDLSGADPDVAANLISTKLVETLSEGSQTLEVGPSGPDAVAMHWNLDGAGFRSQNQAGSPDRDYLWLERLTSLPVELSAGAHTLTFEYGGSDPRRKASVDGFLLMPAMLQKTFTSPQGTLVLTYDIESGKISFQE